MIVLDKIPVRLWDFIIEIDGIMHDLGDRIRERYEMGRDWLFALALDPFNSMYFFYDLIYNERYLGYSIDMGYSGSTDMNLPDENTEVVPLEEDET